MCAIIDANTVREVFGPNRPPAGKKFFDWINNGKGLLVVGGKLNNELDKSSQSYRQWAQEAKRRGVLIEETKSKIDKGKEELLAKRVCKSDDLHILALARVSGARLLYSNDKNLQADFKNKELIDNPRGKVYSTLKCDNFSESHQKLLSQSKC